jgi:hypothetical protein
MNLPRVRLSITLAEYGLLQPGITSLVNGLASAKLDLYPNRHAFDRIDFKASAIHVGKAFDASMAQRSINLKFSFVDMIGTRKARLDVFELATAAVALRVSKTLARKSGLVYPNGEHESLAGKLEKYRKQAKRAVVARLGDIGYDAMAKVWSAHLHWIRYYLTQFTVAKPSLYSGRALWQEQREALASMITEALQERHYAPLSRGHVARLATLAKNALRRGRLPMKLRELLLAGRPGRDLLYDFIKKRVKLDALPGAEVSPVIACMLKADVFNAYLNRNRQL